MGSGLHSLHDAAYMAYVMSEDPTPIPYTSCPNP
jgi:hypothetical protein